MDPDISALITNTYAIILEKVRKQKVKQKLWRTRYAVNGEKSAAKRAHSLVSAGRGRFPEARARPSLSHSGSSGNNAEKTRPAAVPLSVNIL